MRYKRATMSVLGLYYIDPDLFSGLVLPDGIDRETTINSILAECAELEILYPDAVYMKNLIYLWSMKELYNWEKLYQTTQLTYNPIWNVDADITEIENRDLKNNYSAGENALNNNINSKTGYNSETFEEAEKDDSTAEINRNGESADTGSITRTTKRGGNIGVTTSQAMIREERDVVRFNIYDEIVNSFKRRFCILIY